MVTVPLDSETLREQLGELLAELALLPETAHSDGPAGAETPTDILVAFGQLMDVMQRLESEYRQATQERQHALAANATEFGDYAGARVRRPCASPSPIGPCRACAAAPVPARHRCSG